MALTLPGIPEIITDQATGPVPCDGCQDVSAYAYPGWATLVDEEELNTLQVDFYTLGRLDYARVRSIMDGLAAQMASGIWIGPWEVVPPHELLAYVLSESIQPMEASIPDQVCIPLVITEWCFSPPGAGQVLWDVYQYRLWLIARPMPSAAPLAVRAAWPMFWGAIGVAIAFTIIAGTVVAIGGVVFGFIKWSELRGLVHEVITAPGENIREATMWPLFAFGFAIVAAGIFLPMLATRIEAKVPVGGGQVTVGGEAIAGRAPATGSRRR